MDYNDSTLRDIINQRLYGVMRPTTGPEKLRMGGLDGVMRAPTQEEQERMDSPGYWDTKGVMQNALQAITKPFGLDIGPGSINNLAIAPLTATGRELAEIPLDMAKTGRPFTSSAWRVNPEGEPLGKFFFDSFTTRPSPGSIDDMKYIAETQLQHMSPEFRQKFITARNPFVSLDKDQRYLTSKIVENEFGVTLNDLMNQVRTTPVKDVKSLLNKHSAGDFSFEDADNIRSAARGFNSYNFADAFIRPYLATAGHDWAVFKGSTLPSGPGTWHPELYQVIDVPQTKVSINLGK